MLTEFILGYIHEVLTAYHNPRNEAGGGGYPDRKELTTTRNAFTSGSVTLCCIVYYPISVTSTIGMFDISQLRRNPPDVGVTSGQKPSTKIITIVLQTSVGLF